MDNRDLRALEKELERLRDLAADMYADKYSKKAEENHRRIKMIEKKIKQIKGER